jgi:hypothetical protein
MRLAKLREARCAKRSAGQTGLTPVRTARRRGRAAIRQPRRCSHKRNGRRFEAGALLRALGVEPTDGEGLDVGVTLAILAGIGRVYREGSAALPLIRFL